MKSLKDTITSSLNSCDFSSLYVADSTGSLNSVASEGIINVSLTDSMKDDVLNYIMNKIGKVPVLEHKCHNCGGTVKMDANNHIFICPYCDSVYAIGTYMINDAG